MATGRANRVAPDGTFHAVAERGGMLGNRGRLLGRSGELVRAFQVRRWLVCVLDFRGRHREQWRLDRYTELYFLDEATAFAAGHRPCAECRWPAYVAYREAWRRAFRLSDAPRADEMDAILHADRMTDRRRRRTFRARTASLPDGTIVALDGGWWLIVGPLLREWTFGGYRAARDRRDAPPTVTVVTPRATVEVLRLGYAPGLHLSAETTRTDATSAQ